MQVEAISGEPWDWWPLAPPKKRLSGKQIHMEWRCRCGRARTEVVTKRFGKALEGLIAKAAVDLANAPRRMRPSAPPSTTTQTGPEPEAQRCDGSGAKRRSRKARVQAWYAFRGDGNGSDMEEDEQDIPPVSDQYTKTLPTVVPRAIYFMVDNASVMPWNSRLGKSVIPTRELCDERFYHNMRWEFWSHRGWLKSLFSLYTFAGCDFYQFERYGRDKYHEAKEDLPEVGDEYLYLRRKLRPQVCWEEFRDGYWDWRRDCTTQKCPTESVISRIPKKKLDHDPNDKTSQSQLPVEVIWGIVARTQRAFYMAAIYVAIAASPLVPATWFFFKWLSPPDEGMDEYQLANHRDNLSNAFVPLGIAIALLLATITCVFSKFE
ncbi:hypothetical protein Micbo1qcDRAFT_165298 [Microdochium bolleyi]|uniref:Uncharacterized protein n=1 Tax=Microdochium bolleyi TaxID=196109 RepID=A0A136IY46_9PEZI|nr:hypothetical protein Micbo1qcDRAFT_165298 [Microdochium bolleyi]